MGKVVKGALIGALIATGVGAAAGLIAGGAAFAGFGAGTFAAYFARQFAINAVLGFISNALAPKPSDLTGAGDLRGQSIMQRSPLAPRKIAYGRVRTSGAIVFLETTGDKNKYLHTVVTLAGHEINAVKEVYLNEQVAKTDLVDAVEVNSDTTVEPNYANFVKFTPHFGSPSQLADTNMVSRTSWSTDHKLSEIAYIYAQMEYNQDTFVSGQPNISAVIEGKKVYDPRTTLTAYSNNAALCLLDYLQDTKYGLAAADDEIDFASFIVAANICDEQVALDAGGTEARYTINGLIDTSKAPSGILQDMASAMAGTVYYSNGQWKCRAGAYITPTDTLTNDDFLSDISITTRVSNQTNFNAVKGVFLSPDDNWQPTDFPAITSATFEAEDNNERRFADLVLPFTTSVATAQRLGKIALYRNREQITVSVSCKLSAFKYEIGDTIMLDYDRFGWSGKVFEVIGWQLGQEESEGVMVPSVLLQLKETSTTVYSWSAATDEAALTRNNTTLPSAFDGLTITNLAFAEGGETQSDGTYIDSFIVTWDDVTSSLVEHYVVEWKPTADTYYSSTTTKNTAIEIKPIFDGVEYTIRVKAVTSFGNSGGYTSIAATSGGDTTAPALPTSISATGGLGFIQISWTNPADLDFNQVEIWENDTDVSGTATLVGKSSGNNFIRANLAPNVTKYYWLKSVDLSGNASAFTASVNATTNLISANDLGDSIIGYDNFASDVTNLFDTIQSDILDKVDIADYNITVDYQQQLDDAVSQLSTDALELALATNSLGTRINDAGIVVNPTTGEVTIAAVSSLGDTVNQVQVDLDAAEAEIQLRATTTYVNNAIAAAVLDSADLASLNDLEARVDTAEIDINSIEGAITLTSTGSLYNVNDGVLGVEALEGRIAINEGQIALKASQADLDNVENRITTAEIDIAAIDAASITQTVQDTRSLFLKDDELSTLTLKEVLGRYADRKAVSSDIALARSSITADVTDQKTALAEAKLELAAQIDSNAASIVSVQTAVADESSARASDVLVLQANIDGVSSTLTTNYYTSAQTDSAISAAQTTLQASIDGVSSDLALNYLTTAQTNSAIAAAELVLQTQIDDVETSLTTSYYSSAATDSAISTAITDNNVTIANTYATISEVSLIEGSVGDLEAKYGVTIDVDGRITGYQLLNGTGGTAFNVRADQFAIFGDGAASGVSPFTVYTTERTIGGVVYPAGTYMDNAFIDTATVAGLLSADKIRTGKMESTDGKFVIDLDNKFIYIE